MNESEKLRLRRIVTDGMGWLNLLQGLVQHDQPEISAVARPALDHFATLLLTLKSLSAPTHQKGSGEATDCGCTHDQGSACHRFARCLRLGD